ncbi:MAG: helix-turn-helix domain-containing protein [Actinobacteria bacterium]|nr:helix-turn-helix domain-containing protein [Actinomycetota bacterium]
MTPTSPSLPAADDLVYTVAEVSERLKISLWMVNKLIRERKLRSIQIGARRLVPASDLEEYLRELRKVNMGVRHGW